MEGDASQSKPTALSSFLDLQLATKVASKSAPETVRAKKLTDNDLPVGADPRRQRQTFSSEPGLFRSIKVPQERNRSPLTREEEISQSHHLPGDFSPSQKKDKYKKR